MSVSETFAESPEGAEREQATASISRQVFRYGNHEVCLNLPPTLSHSSVYLKLAWRKTTTDGSRMTLAFDLEKAQFFDSITGAGSVSFNKRLTEEYLPGG